MLEIIKEKIRPAIRKSGLELKYLSRKRPPKAKITSGRAIMYPNSQAKFRALKLLTEDWFGFSAFLGIKKLPGTNN